MGQVAQLGRESGEKFGVGQIDGDEFFAAVEPFRKRLEAVLAEIQSSEVVPPCDGFIDVLDAIVSEIEDGHVLHVLAVFLVDPADPIEVYFKHTYLRPGTRCWESSVRCSSCFRCCSPSWRSSSRTRIWSLPAS